MKKSISTLFAAQAINWSTPIKLRSLRVRLALWGLLLLGITQVWVSFVLYTAISTWLEEQVDSSLQLTAAQVASVLFDPEDPQNPIDITDVQLQLANESSVAAQSFLRERLFFVRLIDLNSGAVLASSADYDIAAPRATVADATFDTISFDDRDQRQILRVHTLPLAYASQYALQVGISLEETREIQGDVFRILAILLLFTGTLALLIGWFMANRALVAIRETARTAAEINETDLSRRLDLAASEIELEQLVQTFNGMLDRIEGAFQRQRQFTTDAAHELRTPLAIMQTHLEVTLSKPRDLAEYRAALISALEEVQRLTKLAGTLLLLARADNEAPALNLLEFDLSLMLNTVIEQFAPASEEKQLVILRDIPPNLVITGDEDRLIQVMFNLIDNAIKFTPDGGQVKVTAEKGHLHVVITVADTGPGIPVDDQALIFERFYRTHAAREHGRGGFGLGLAIAHRIITLHGGTIKAYSPPGQGSLFVVELPTAPRP